MAVSIGTSVANPAGVSASSNVATYSNISIGAAAEDRIVALVVTAELTNATPNSATIDFGSGAVAMEPSTLGSFGVMRARIFWLPVPTGTTATFAVTFGANPTNVQNHVSVYRIVGARPLPTTGGNGSTDMDATAPLTTGSITIATDGGFLAVAAGATDTVAKTWANATEDLDIDAGAFRHTTATRTTAGTVTVTCTGATNGEDGAMSWSIWTPGTLVVATAGSYTLSGTDAALERGYAVVADAEAYALTGSDATLTKAAAAKTLAADAGSYTLTGTDAALERGREVAADAGSYTFTGTDADLELGREVTADAGSYTLAGTDASLEYGREIVADPGAYALTGSDAGLEHGREIVAGAGSYALAGTNATLTYSGNVASTGRIEVSWASFEAPTAGNRIEVSWASFEAPDAPIEPTLVDTGDGRKRDLDRREFDRKQDEWKRDLRRIVEEAFNGRKEVAQAAPLPKPEKRKLAKSILAQTDFGPMQVSLAEIIRQIDEYQALLIVEAKRRDDEEAILMLMLAE